ncbi:MAG: zinc metalloprotease HtpX [Chloroflexi bacterium]|nr:zinc metalloprotease HtpX [Chloroflexota bacterium]
MASNQPIQLTRDNGLRSRMYLTMFMLAGVYAFFILLLIAAGIPLVFVVGIAAVMVGIQYFASDRMILRSTGAKEVTREEAPELYDMVERLAIRADVPMPKVAIMESAAPNAFATGRNPKNALVAVTTGIQERLTRRELEAVIGHELSHVKNRDVTVITLASFFLTVASFVMQMMFFRMMFGGFGGGRNNNGGAIMMLMVGTLVVQFVAQLLIMALSRYREYGADHSGAELTGDPGALANALEKISAASSRVPAEDLRKMTAASALAFYPALKGHSMQSLFSTHPPLEDRIARLRQMENEMRGLPQDIRFEN